MRGFLNRLLAKGILITTDDLVIREHLRRAQDTGLHTNGFLLNYEVPVLQSLLTEECFDHLLNPADLFSGVDPRLRQCISHARTFANRVWHTIKQTELSWQEKLPLSDLNKEHRLLGHGDALVVGFEEVIGD